MTLRFRVAVFVSTIFSVLALALYLVFNSTLMTGFLNLENEGALRNATRAQEGIDTLADETALKAEEWGTWDDSYNFIQDLNEEYASSNLTFEALDQLFIKHFLMLDMEGKVIKGIFVDKEAGEVKPIDETSLEALSKVSKLAMEKQGKVGGLVRIGEFTFIVGAAPLTNSAGDAPFRGTILFSRDFGKEAVSKLQQLARVFIRIEQMADLKNEKVLGQTFLESLSLNHSTTLPTATEIHAVNSVKDIFGKPIHGLVTSQSRDLLVRGLEARDTVTFYVLLFTLGAVFAALLLLNRIVIEPLRVIGRQTKEIGELQSDEMRVDLAGDSEIRELGQEINKMLDQLSLSKKDTVDARIEAERANAAKSMFIARVSHELRTPVGGIVGINRIIKKKDGLPRAVRELVEMGDHTANGLLSIIDEILDFAKAESGELTFEAIPFDLRNIVRETMQTVAGRLEGKYRPEERERVQLVCDVNPNVPQKVAGDPTKLRQILTNLLGNAVKFTQKGHIALRVQLEQTAGSGFALRFEVADTGLGIRADKLGAIFDPFKQADSATTRKFQGTGLGLSIVKQFAEGMGGTVSVASEYEKGSVFTVILPFGEIEASTQISCTAKPVKTAVLAANSAATSAITWNLSLLAGSAAEHLSPAAEGFIADVFRACREADLLVVSEEVFDAPEVFSALGTRMAAMKGTAANCTVAMLRPSNLELREKLYAMGLKYVLSTPVMADDLLLAYSGLLQVADLGPQAEEEALKLDRKLKILIVDDLITNRIYLEDMLGDAGHDVTSACDGTEMVDKLRQMIDGEPGASHFDIVLTDISMAIMNGDDATRAVRELERLKPNGVHVPIIAVTAHAFQEEHEKIRQAGVDGILVKPLQPEKVAQEFARLLAAAPQQ